MVDIGLSFGKLTGSQQAGGGRAAHAAPKRDGPLAQVMRFIRELPARGAGPRHAASGSVEDTHVRWLRGIATTINQTERLQTAVNAGNFEEARTALRDGADPDGIRLPKGASPKIADLMSVARRVKLLYPERPTPTSSGPTHARSAIEQLVQGFDVTGARAFLTNISRDPEWLWSAAREGGREDLLRAILAVGSESLVHHLARQPADFHTAAAHGVAQGETAGFLHVGIDRVNFSRALTDYLASIPGLNAALLRNINGEADVWCRHWATLWVETAAATKVAEPIDYSLFHAHDALLEEYTVEELQRRFEALRNSATEVYAVGNHVLGYFAADRLAAMKNGESVQFLVTTANHAMALELERREDRGETVYTVRFYDPNLTTSHVVAEARDLSTVERWRLDGFLRSDEDRDAYFRHQDAICLMYALPEGGIPEEAAQPDRDRRLVRSYGVPALRSPTTVWHLAAQEFNAELQGLPQAIAHMDDQEAVEVLSARPDAWTHRQPSMFFMMNYRRDSDMLRLYTETLRRCRAPVRQQVLRNLIGEFQSYVRSGSFSGRETLGFANLLDRLGWGGSDVVQLLAGPLADGSSMTYWDLREGRPDAIRTVGVILDGANVHPDAWRTTLTPYRDGVPGLGYALSEGHAEAIEALAEVLQRSPLTSAERMEVVRGPYRAEGAQYHAMEAGYRCNQPEALRAYGAMLANCLTPADGAALMTEILCGRDARGRAFFRQGWGSAVEPETRAALAETIARFRFTREQAEHIHAAIGINVLAGEDAEATRVLPRQMRRTI